MTELDDFLDDINPSSRELLKRIAQLNEEVRRLRREVVRLREKQEWWQQW